MQAKIALLTKLAFGATVPSESVREGLRRNGGDGGRGEDPFLVVVVPQLRGMKTEERLWCGVVCVSGL